jgi:hypothetical protein
MERSAGGGVEPMVAEGRADCGGRDLEAKPKQFALNVLVAQREFSLASRRISACTSWSSDGRPGP